MKHQNSTAARRLSQLAAPRAAHGRTVRDLRDGGHVRGPGTHTSDSIDARLSDEEYVLPADTTKAVGVSALDALRKATHRPAKRSGYGYADGGQVKRDDGSKPNSFGDAAAVAQAPGAVQLVNGGAAGAAGAVAASAPSALASTPQLLTPPSAASTPSLVRAAFDSAGVISRANSFGDSAAAQQDPRVSRIPTGGSAADQIPTSGNRPAPAADGSQSNPFNTEIGRNIMNSAAALPGLGGVGQVASTGGRISSAFNAASRAVNAVGALAASQAISLPSGGRADVSIPTVANPGGGNAGRGTADEPRRMDMDPGRQSLGSARDFTAELNRVPDMLPADMRDGVVIKTVDPKTGGVTYSGRNVVENAQGQTQMVDGVGRDLKMLGQPTGNFVQGLAGNAKPNSFAAPGVSGAVFTDGRAPSALPGSPVALQDGPSSGPSRSGAGYQLGRIAQPVNLSGGGKISAQNMAAADALASRNDGSMEARAAMNKRQYDEEVKAAQDIMSRPVVASSGSLGFNRDPRVQAAEERSVELLNRSRGADPFSRQLKLKQQELDQAKQRDGRTLTLAERRDGRDELSALYDNAGKQRQNLLQAQIVNGNQSERSSAAEALRAISGKEKLPRWSINTVQGGSDADGVKQPGYAVMGDQASGAYKIIAPGRQGGPSTGPKYPEGQVLNGKDGKTYVVKNGVPVLK